MLKALKILSGAFLLTITLALYVIVVYVGMKIVNGSV